MQDQKTLFEDKDVKITNKRVFIKCYYFPIGTSKSIGYEEIEKVQVRALDMGKLRIWGMSAFHWGYWFAGDCSRPQRDQFIAVYVGSCIVPTFTTQNTSQVHNILLSQIRKHRHQQSPIEAPIHNQNSMERNLIHQ